ncbi:MAG: VWA domain-containing protein [Planctomycetota bacterium]
MDRDRGHEPLRPRWRRPRGDPRRRPWRKPQRDPGRRRAPLPGLPQRPRARRAPALGRAAQAARVRPRRRRRGVDLEATIDERRPRTGDPELVLRPPRRPNTRVILLMDVGGSMDPFSDLVSRLFTAASKATHFKELRCYYFHNCIYGRVYETESFPPRGLGAVLIADCGRHYKLVFVGDALMALYELLDPRRLALRRRGPGRAAGDRLAGAPCGPLRAQRGAGPGGPALSQRDHDRARVQVVTCSP